MPAVKIDQAATGATNAPVMAGGSSKAGSDRSGKNKKGSASQPLAATLLQGPGMVANDLRQISLASLHSKLTVSGRRLAKASKYRKSAGQRDLQARARTV